MDVVKEAGIDIRDYGLPGEENELHKIVNSKLNKFENLVKKMIKEENRILKRLVSFLKEELLC